SHGPIEVVAGDERGVTLTFDARPSSSAHQGRLLLLAVQVLADWRLLHGARGIDKARAFPFLDLLDSLKNDERRPVFVCFPWKPATDKLPARLADEFTWRAQNGKPSPTFLT